MAKEENIVKPPKDGKSQNDTGDDADGQPTTVGSSTHVITAIIPNLGLKKPCRGKCNTERETEEHDDTRYAAATTEAMVTKAAKKNPSQEKPKYCLAKYCRANSENKSYF